MAATDLSVFALIGPLIAFGIGFSLVLSSMTAVAVYTVALPLAGTASAATGVLRDFGMTLGPAVIGAVPSAMPLRQGGTLAVNGLPPSSPLVHGAHLAETALG